MTTVLTLAEILDLADPFGEFKTGDAQGDKRVQYARAVERAVLESIARTFGAEDSSLPAGSAEDDYFMVDAAMQHGFVPIDDDGDVFVCTSRQVVALMQAAEQQGRTNAAEDDGYVPAVDLTKRVPQQWVDYVSEIVQSAEGYQRRTGDTVNGNWVERGRALLNSAKANPSER